MVIKNAFWLGVAEVVSRLVEFALIIQVVRVLGVAEFGKFTFALAFVSVVAVIFDLGLFNTITRELSYGSAAEKDYPAILSLKLVLNVTTFVFIVGVSFLVTGDSGSRLAFWMMGIFVLVNDFFSVLYAFIRARQKMEFEAAAKIIRSLVLAGVVSWVIARFPSLGNISLGYVIANAVALAVVLLLFHVNVQHVVLRFHTGTWKKLLAISWPLGLAAVFGATVISADSIMMGYLGQTTENGWYNAAQKLISAIVIVATLISMSFYPLLSRLFHESKELLQRAWNYYMEAMIILAVPVVTGGFFLAPRIIPFIFGDGFEPSIVVFRVLIFVAGMSFICYPYITILIVSRQQAKYVWVNMAGAVVSVMLNAVLIPRYSLYGASAAAIATYVVLLVLSAGFSRRFTSVAIFNARIFNIFLLSAAASFAMVLLVYQLIGFGGNIVMGIVSGVVIYAVILLTAYRNISWSKVS